MQADIEHYVTGDRQADSARLFGQDDTDPETRAAIEQFFSVGDESHKLFGE
jgi:hypothetical protein